MQIPKLDINEVLEQQEKVKKTFAKSDKNRERKRVEATIQVSLYLNQDEIDFLEKACKEDFISRNAFIRKLIAKERQKRE